MPDNRAVFLLAALDCTGRGAYLNGVPDAATRPVTGGPVQISRPLRKRLIPEACC